MTAAASPAAPSKKRRGLSDRLYALLVHAYPAEVRDEFAEDMIGMFRAQRRAAGKNLLRRARLWMLAFTDVAVHATGERRAHRDAVGSGRPPSPRRSFTEAARALRDDLIYAMRALLRRPKFSALAALILAVGVGTSTAMFGIVDATFMRPLPYRDADRLMDLWTYLPDNGFTVNAISLEAVRAWRQQRAIFEGVEAYERDSIVILGGGEPQRLTGAYISPGLLTMLGVEPASGRGFGAGDAAPGAAPVVLISERLWRQRYGAEASALGQDVRMEDGTVTVVGVLPSSFQFPSTATDVWLPLPLTPHSTWSDRASINAVGRLQPELSQERAQQLVDVESENLTDAVSSPFVRLRAWEELRAQPTTRSSLLMLLGAVGFLVLIATANLANLLLAQTTTRSNEIAVRAALGATRARVARQVLAESALLALLGGAAGIVLATWLLRVAVTAVPSSMSLFLPSDVGVDARVVLFALTVSLGIGLAMGILPAISCTHGGSAAATSMARGASRSRRHARTRGVLVVAEVGLSLLLLVGAGLLVNSFARLQRIDPGFDPDNLLLAEMRFNPDRYASESERLLMLDELDALVEGLPGVVGATVGGGAPPVPGSISFGISPEAEGMTAAPVDDLVLPIGVVAPDYFEVVGIPFAVGSTFAASSSEAARTVIINETVADHYWGDVDPLGKRFRLDADDEWRTVVGVVRDVRAASPDDPYGSFEIYYPFGPGGETPLYTTITVRTREDPMSLVEAIKSQVWSLDPDQPIGFQRATEVLAGLVERPRFYLQLVGAFALIAAMLAAFGLYGVLSYGVGQRLHEIGIRMALGESERGILRRVVGGGLSLATTGVGLGLGAAAALSRYLESLLYEVRPIDALTFAAAAGAMLLIAALACYFPARRATRVDPVEALRAE